MLTTHVEAVLLRLLTPCRPTIKGHPPGGGCPAERVPGERPHLPDTQPQEEADLAPRGKRFGQDQPPDGCPPRRARGGGRWPTLAGCFRLPRRPARPRDSGHGRFGTSGGKTSGHSRTALVCCLPTHLKTALGSGLSQRRTALRPRCYYRKNIECSVNYSLSTDFFCPALAKARGFFSV